MCTDSKIVFCITSCIFCHNHIRWGGGNINIFYDTYFFSNQINTPNTPVNYSDILEFRKTDRLKWNRAHVSSRIVFLSFFFFKFCKFFFVYATRICPLLVEVNVGLNRYRVKVFFFVPKPIILEEKRQLSCMKIRKKYDFQPTRQFISRNIGSQFFKSDLEKSHITTNYYRSYYRVFFRIRKYISRKL